MFVEHSNNCVSLEILKTIDKADVNCNSKYLGVPGGTVVKNLPANAGDMGSSPGLGRSHMPWSN